MNPFLIAGIIGAGFGLLFHLPLLCLAAGIFIGAGVAELARK